MVKLEEAVRSIKMEGLLWGACMSLLLNVFTTYKFWWYILFLSAQLLVFCNVEGLPSLAAKLMPVGYGIKKLQIMMTIIDDLVSVDTLIEDHLCVEPANEYIQSCDIVAFNKICKFSFCPSNLLA